MSQGRLAVSFADIFKWRYFRYDKVEEKLWLRQHNLYRIAEFDGFQGNTFKVYANDHQVLSCKARIPASPAALAAGHRQLEARGGWRWSTAGWTTGPTCSP